ncbi:alpha/beta-hydrolase [Piedraia hortae CBS 480.64]|uniref:Carboxypeptidase n=1 Tax=Piedraia hortae CBS 480.64 TaxID=1314780 RepID=A0A6A7C034_9PEZI|nr:alpha/beta-hydrolase [Piedraia hortae CBS 480.64]
MVDIWRLPSSLVALAIAALSVSARAQYPPPASYESVLASPLNPAVTIAYRQPDNGTCMAAFDAQRQFTGYIGLPPYTLAPIQQNYSVNTFFWFVEARQQPDAAPLTIWLNGGPGSSSLFGLFNEVGPCQVVQLNDGLYGTQMRPFGWDRSSNVLFIDQPNQVGFSYDAPANASIDFYTSNIFDPSLSQSNLPPWMVASGTFGASSLNSSAPGGTANTTAIAAHTLWHFLQAWLAAFPEYNPALRNGSAVDGPSVGVHLFTESYGGMYAPAMAMHFEQQNQLRENGSMPTNSTLPMHLETVGIINGMIDSLIQTPTLPQFAANNSYGVQAISQTQMLNAISQWELSCVSQIGDCRDAVALGDANGYGDNATVNAVCSRARVTCNNLSGDYTANNHSPYDIRRSLPMTEPSGSFQEYLNSAGVLQAVGARVNFTGSNLRVSEAFDSTGDLIRGGSVDDLAALLGMGVRVALLYGDADYICNWQGGEAVSLAIAQAMANATDEAISRYSTAFPAAGYSYIATNSSYVGGEVRQYGNFSFSRIYEAGHFVPYYQPETAFTLFTRAIYGAELATGQLVDTTNLPNSHRNYSTKTHSVRDGPAPTCWLRDWVLTCSQEETRAMLESRGHVMNGIYIQESKSDPLPTTSVTAGRPGSPVTTPTRSKSAVSSSTSVLTGVYTATNTPTPSSSAILIADGLDMSLSWGILLLFLLTGYDIL